LTLGDDVTKKVAQQYYGFRRIKNFACVEAHPRTRTLLAFVNVDPDMVTLEHGFTRDVRSVGHIGTGDLEIRIATPLQVTRAEELPRNSYERS
jgi:predicted transport protein